MMNAKEKRNYVRIKSVNLLSYVYFDEDKKPETQGMGRTLNVSEAGLLLEATKSFKVNREISINIGLEEELISINGTVIFTNSDTSGFSNSGIQFSRLDETELTRLKDFIAAYQVET